MIIGVGGNFCSGKTTAAIYYTEVLKRSKIINFADKIKDIAKDVFGMTIKDRRLLQAIGEKMREIDPDVWINYVFNAIEKDKNKFLSRKKDYIIGDVRHDNEIFKIREAGGFSVYIKRNLKLRKKDYELLYGSVPTNEELNHESEQINYKLFDFVLDNNNDLENFRQNLKEVLYHGKRKVG